MIPASGSAGIDYPHVVTAAIDFVVYRFPSRGITCPASSCCRTGGDVVHLDGRLYRPGSGRMAILSCRDLATGRRVASGWPRRD